MVNTIASKTSVKTIAVPNASGQKTPEKTELSKFDRVRLQLPDQLPDQKFVLRDNLKKAESSLENLRYRIDAEPKTSAFDYLRSRLSSIEAQFRESGRLLSRLDAVDNPRDLLKIQAQMYKLIQNVEIMSKVVDQVVNKGINPIINMHL